MKAKPAPGNIHLRSVTRVGAGARGLFGGEDGAAEPAEGRETPPAEGRAPDHVPGPGRPPTFPFSVPAIRSLTTLEFSAPVTFFVGENGCGKSTLLEALALAAGSIAAGSQSLERDPTLKGLRELAQSLRLVWTRRTHRGFFMRSEDFFGYARQIGALRREMEQGLEDVERDYRDRSTLARNLAASAYAGQLGALKRDYGAGLDAQSHGESYLKMFQRRFVPGGLYILDEPEAPLSPTRQLAFLALMHSMVEQQAQFIIATHSPILMAYPGAAILQMDDGQIRPVSYDAIEHVRVTRDFLAHPAAYLRHLFDDENV